MASPSRADPRHRVRRAAAGAVSLPHDALVGHPARLALIEQSHQRCAALGLSRIERPDYEPLMRSDLAVARERNQRLSKRAAPVMEMLLEQIINTHSMIVLTDAQGTVLHTVGDDDFLERANQVALAPGVNWAEHSKGTNAIGTALFAETPTLVHAGEHFMHAHSFLTCSAAPIFDPRGNMLGVLDVTGDHRSYHQHTMGLVRMSARMIENHWLTDDYTDRLRLHFHARNEFIGTLLEGIVVVGADGRLLGANRSALDQLGLSMAGLRSHSLASLFSTSAAAVIDHLRQPLALPMELHLADGRRVYASARYSGPQALALRSLSQPAALPIEAVGAPVERRPAPPPSGAHAWDMPPHHAAPRADPAAAGRAPSGLAYLDTGDAAIVALIGKLRRVRNRGIPLLIVGETGTGKELLARAIHQDSERAKQAFVAVNCAALPEALIEAELFGHDETAVTGGRRKGSAGRIVQANGGTLFLDEIGELPAGLQARLLRVLQERSVTPLGSHKPIPVDIAVIGASRQRLRELIDQGRFREDLYHHLNGLSVRLPALRERSDLPALAARILAGECPHDTPAISPEVMQLLRRGRWPGNVRQLINVLRSAAVMAAGEGCIVAAHLPDDFMEDVVDPSACPGGGAVPGAEPQTDARPAERTAANTLQQAENAMIRQVLDAVGGNISEASKRLGISRNTVYRKLRGHLPQRAR